MSTSTTATADPPVPEQPPAPEPAPARRGVPRTGWVQAALLTAATVVLLRVADVPVTDSLLLLGYVAVAVVLPGTLIWRAVAGRGAPLVEDLAAGLAVGYVCEVLAYIAARWLGVPQWTVAWAVGTVVAFAAVPALRQYWRRAATGDRPPVWWSWGVSGTVALLFAWSGLAWFRSAAVDAAGYGRTDADMPFHLALTGELRHHMPGTVPWLNGEPLYYHWFVYAEHAATSWATGIEPQLLLYRLAPLPVLAATAVLIGALARRLTGAWWTGWVAVVMTFLVLAPNPYGWRLAPYFDVYGFGIVEDGSLLRPTMWMSPTQTFGALIALPAAMLLVEVLDGRSARRAWALLTLLLVGVMGAKATFLPIFLCGLLLVAVVRSWVDRRVHRPAVGALALVAGCLAFAQFVLFGGASQGMSLTPLTSMRESGLAITSMFVPPGAPAWRLALVTMVFALAWAAVWCGGLGLLRQRRILRAPFLLLAGMGVAGMGAVAAFAHPGASQYFFLESARPFLAVLSVCGLAALAGPLRRRTGAALVLAAAAGAVAVWLIRALDGPTTPVLAPGIRPRTIGLVLLWPYAAVVVVVGAAAVALFVARRRIGGLATAGALLLAVVTGLCLPSGVDQVRQQALTHPNGYVGAVDLLPPVTPGTREAGRWLRDHSGRGDLVATNAHCRSPRGSACVPLHFSVAAFTERRVLVEGWGYTPTLNARIMRGQGLGFWDPALLAANDAAFERPSAETVGRLRDGYGVRWLFVDDLHGTPGPDLGRFAELRYRAHHVTVYELTR